MNTKVLWLIFMMLTFSSTAFSQMDPRAQQYFTGTTQLVGAATSVAWAHTNSAACGACVSTCWACVWAVTGYTGAVANATSAGYSFYQASTLSTTGGGGTSLPPGAQNCINDPRTCADLGTPVDTHNTTPQPSPDDIKRLSGSANNILNLAQQGLEDLKISGHMPPDLNDPSLAEKLPPMTPAEKAALQDYENKKANMDAMSTQEKVDMLLSSDYSSGGFRGVAGSDEFSDSFDPNSFLAMFQNQGMENSAPGYYGNVPLQALNPHSKLSLFQRISLKMKNFK